MEGSQVPHGWKVERAASMAQQRKTKYGVWQDAFTDKYEVVKFLPSGDMSYEIVARYKSHEKATARAAALNATIQ